MSCIICQDSGLESLTDNSSCSCKYKVHNSCWVDYVNSQKQLKCIMCRKDISTSSKSRVVQQTTPLITVHVHSTDSHACGNTIKNFIYENKKTFFILLLIVILLTVFAFIVLIS